VHISSLMWLPQPQWSRSRKSGVTAVCQMTCSQTIRPQWSCSRKSGVTSTVTVRDGAADTYPKRHPYCGKVINKYIYEQLPPGVLDELRRLNPRTERGYRTNKHFQFLTADTGNPHLDRQISTVTTLLRIANSKAEFEDLFDRAFAPQMRLPLVIEVPAESDDSAQPA
jgi:hypothetical protein